MTKLSPFDFVKAINQTKEDLMDDEENIGSYVPFVVNRALSYYPDTVLCANEMNMYSGIDKRMQFGFYLNIVTKAKRFSKWCKPEELSDIEVMKQYYNVSNNKAKELLMIMDTDQVDQIKTIISERDNE